MKLVVQAAARSDLDEQAEFLEATSARTARRFLVAAEESFRFLLENPHAGVRRDSYVPRLHGVRMWPVRGFERHLIFYRASDDLLEIVRVLHSSRDIDSILERP